MLLDEIYGEENRVGIIPVRNNPPGRTMSNYFATTHEYYLFYAKNKRKVSIGDLKLDVIFCISPNGSSEVTEVT